MSVQSIGLVTATCTTLSSNGSISVPGLKVGDKLIGVWNTDSNLWGTPGDRVSNLTSGLEAVVSVADEIQQIDTPFATGTNLTLLLLRQ